MKFIRTAILAAGLICAGSVSAALVDFEGTTSDQSIGNYYSGLGITFGPAAYTYQNTIPDFPVFANAPSPIGVMGVTDADATMNHAIGFNGVVSLFYSSAVDTTVDIWSGENGTGSIVDTFTLAANLASCAEGVYCNWSPLSINLGANIGRSIVFGSAVGVGFDNVSVSAVPVPAALPLLAMGVAGMGAFMRRRKQASAA